MQNMDTSVASSPYFNAYLAAQVKANDNGFLSKDITVRDLISHRGDIHHIFPREYLKGKGLRRGEYNQIANYVYMQSEINVKIGKKSPKDYFEDLKKQCNGGRLKYGGIDDEKALMENLRMNCIPESIFDMEIDDYNGFLVKRRQLIAKKTSRNITFLYKMNAKRYCAFIDECGNSDFAIENVGATSHFIVTCILVDEDALNELERNIDIVRKKHFQTGPIKSSYVSDNDDRRIQILQDLCSFDFSIYALVVDKKRLVTEGFRHKQSFIKFLHGQVDRELYRIFPRLSIYADSLMAPKNFETDLGNMSIMFIFRIYLMNLILVL